MSSANKLYFILTRPGISVCVSALSPFLSQRCHLSLHLTVWKPQKQESIQSISEGTCPFSENYTVNVEISVWGKSNRKILRLFLSFFFFLLFWHKMLFVFHTYLLLEWINAAVFPRWSHRSETPAYACKKRSQLDA